MDDVLRDVVLAPGDEYLRSRQAIVVAVRLCPRAHCREVGACLRLGQVHGSSPFASDHFRQEALLKRGRRGGGVYRGGGGVYRGGGGARLFERILSALNYKHHEKCSGRGGCVAARP